MKQCTYLFVLWMFLNLTSAAVEKSTETVQYARLRVPSRVSSASAPATQGSSGKRYVNLRQRYFTAKVLRKGNKIGGIKAYTIPGGQRTVVTSYPRPERRRLWSSIGRMRSDFLKLRSTCEAVRRNNTLLARHLDRHKSEFKIFQSETNEKLRQIESHQETQDYRYFELFESTTNNTAEVSQLQALVDSLQDVYDDGTTSLARLTPLLPMQESIELQYDNLSGGNEISEEQMEAVYESVVDNLINPRVEEQNRKISIMEESLHRTEERFVASRDETKSYHRELAYDEARQRRNVRKKFSEINETLEEFKNNLTRAGNRMNGLQNEIQHQMEEFVSLRSSVNRMNEFLESRGLNEGGGTHDILDVREDLMHEQIERISYSMRHQMERMSNISRSVRSAKRDLRYMSMRNSNVYGIINKVETAVMEHRDNITALFLKNIQQEEKISFLEHNMEDYHSTVMTLLDIVTNLGEQIRRPAPQHKDCHDLRISGHHESGVYSLIHDMNTKNIYCNMTDSGGWTVIQRRNDGAQDFDRSWQEYKGGFGNIFGEFWLGLDTIRWLTHGRIYTLMVIIEDWGGNKRYAVYDRFLVFGNEYQLMVSGYRGDAGDSMSQNNEQTFKVREEGRHMTVTSTSDCTTTHKSGWWFTPSCGDANPNGPYVSDPVQVLMSERHQGTPSLVSIPYWMSWRGEDYPLKKISMQIIPREALDEEAFHFIDSTEQKKADFSGVTNEEGFDRTDEKL